MWAGNKMLERVFGRIVSVINKMIRKSWIVFCLFIPETPFLITALCVLAKILLIVTVLGGTLGIIRVCP